MNTTMKSNSDKKKGLLLIKLSFFTFIVFCILLIPCQSHYHHEHSQEPPSYKYSKQANEHLMDKHHHHHHEHHKPHDHHHKLHEHHDHHYHSHSNEDEKPYWRPMSDYMNHVGDVFIQAMGSTFLISIAPFLALYFVPLDNSKESEPLLKILLSFASGGLLGDAFLHLIPHALTQGHHQHEHTHSHDSSEGGHTHDTSVGLCVLGGIVMFLLVEKTVHLIKGGHTHSHSHSHSHHGPAQKEEATLKEKNDEDKSSHSEKRANSCAKVKENHHDEKRENNFEEKRDTSCEEKKDTSYEEKDTSEETEKGKGDNLGKKSECQKDLQNPVNDIKVAGYLNLAADFLHNFTDGLAIGASYLAGNTVGYVTSLTILLHEVPHEIGDFAILIQSGCSKPKAIMLQLVTAIGALLGTFISLLVGGMGDLATRWILPFTAGGFIYIATVSVIPELLVNTKFWQSVKEIIAIIIGVYMMVLVSEYE